MLDRRPGELHALADGGQVGDAHTGGGTEPVAAGAGTGRTQGAGCGGTGHGRFLPLSAGKIATADVMGCYACDWCDAPDVMDARYRSVT